MYTCYIESFKILAVAEQAGLNLTWLKIPEDMFSRDKAHLFYCCMAKWFPAEIVRFCPTFLIWLVQN